MSQDLYDRTANAMRTLALAGATSVTFKDAASRDAFFAVFESKKPITGRAPSVDGVYLLTEPESAVPGEPVKSEAFMCGYERAQGRWEATHEELYEHNCWLRNPFEAGTDEQKGFSQAVYDLTK